MRKNLSRLLLVAFLAFPLPLHGAGSTLVEDTVAGLDTSVHLSGFSSATSFDVHVENPEQEDTTIPTKTDSDGTARVLIPGALLRTAGTYHAFTTQNGTRLSAVASFDVLPDRIDASTSSMEIDTDRIQNDGLEEATITVTLQDRFGNPLPGRPVELVGSRLQDQITALARETDARGMQRFTLRTRIAGEIILRAMDLLSGTTLSNRVSIVAGNSAAVGGDTPIRSSYTAQLTGGSAGEAVSFSLSLTPASPKVRDVLDLRVTALDANGNTALDYVGTPDILSPNDSNSVLPGFGSNGKGQLTFTAKDQGSKRFPLSVSFTKAGEQVLIVQDGAIKGQLSVTVAGGDSASSAPAQKIEIVSHKNDSKITGTSILLEGIGPKLSNLTITGGKEDTQAETDEKGFFSQKVDLDPAFNEYSIRVRSEKGADSGVLRLVRDNKGPDVTDITLDPQQAQAGSDIQLTIKSESNLKQVRLKIGQNDVDLTEATGTPGTYSVIFQAPTIPGKYQPAIVAIDDAGNTTEVRSTLTVVPRDLQSVQNVKGEAGISGVKLTWDPLQGEKVTSYIVYVGTEPGNYSSTLDTKENVTTANVMGLTPGLTYYFAVTAKEGDRESPEKSTEVSVTTIGLGLKGTPSDHSITLEWTGYQENAPLKEFLLEYGVDGTFTEKRHLDPAMRLKQVDDLLPNVTYNIRLTPMDITGKFMTDLSQTITVTTLASEGFIAGSEDPVPPLTGSTTPPPDFHSGAPEVPESGLPMRTILWTVGGSVLCIGFLIAKQRRSRRKTAEFLQLMQQRYHG